MNFLRLSVASSKSRSLASVAQSSEALRISGKVRA